MLNFGKRTIQPKNSSKIICNGNPWREFFENLGIPTEVIIFLEIPKNAVPFRKRMETKPKLIGVVESAFINCIRISDTLMKWVSVLHVRISIE